MRQTPLLLARERGAIIPQPGWDRVRFFVPQSQGLRIKQSGQFERIQLIREGRLFPEVSETSATGS